MIFITTLIINHNILSSPSSIYSNDSSMSMPSKSFCRLLLPSAALAFASSTHLTIKNRTYCRKWRWVILLGCRRFRIDLFLHDNFLNGNLRRFIIRIADSFPIANDGLRNRSIITNILKSTGFNLDIFLIDSYNM